MNILEKDIKDGIYNTSSPQKTEKQWVAVYTKMVKKDWNQKSDKKYSMLFESVTNQIKKNVHFHFAAAQIHFAAAQKRIKEKKTIKDKEINTNVAIHAPENDERKNAEEIKTETQEIKPKEKKSLKHSELCPLCDKPIKKAKGGEKKQGDFKNGEQAKKDSEGGKEDKKTGEIQTTKIGHIQPSKTLFSTRTVTISIILIIALIVASYFIYQKMTLKNKTAVQVEDVEYEEVEYEEVDKPLEYTIIETNNIEKIVSDLYEIYGVRPVGGSNAEALFNIKVVKK